MKFHCREPIDDTCHCSSDKKLFAGKNLLIASFIIVSMFLSPVGSVLMSIVHCDEKLSLRSSWDAAQTLRSGSRPLDQVFCLLLDNN